MYWPQSTLEGYNSTVCHALIQSLYQSLLICATRSVSFVLYSVFWVLYFVFSVLCSVPLILCWVSFVLFSISVHCSLPFVLCSMSFILCSLSFVLCSVSFVLFSVSVASTDGVQWTLFSLIASCHPLLHCWSKHLQPDSKFYRSGICNWVRCHCRVEKCSAEGA